MVTRRSLIGGMSAAFASAAVGKASLGGLPEIVTMDSPTMRPPLEPPNGRPYLPVATLNGWTLPWRMREGVKEFHLVAEPVEREIAPGMRAHLWGYNGQSPGPTIEVVEGDRVRIFVTNRLSEPTSIHWHGQRLPNGMDGVSGLNQPSIKAGQTFVVSGAAGSVGSLAGQIAKILGAKVIGIAGSAEKCAWLTGELGFDHAIDYQRENVRKRLHELCPNGVDVYFENVGGAVGNAVIANLAKGARIALCGLVSQYNAEGEVPGLDMLPILLKSCTVQGFILLDYLHRLGEASHKLGQWLGEGKIKFHADVTDGLENALTAFKTLFQSGASHKGKMMIRVDPSAN